MQLFATFDHNLYVEMAVSTLEKNGVDKNHIFAVPLDNRTEAPKLFDTIHQSDGVSLIDIGMALATAFSVIGVSVGFKMTIGPIWMGIISAFIGLAIGVAIRLTMVMVFQKRDRPLKGRKSEMILIVECPETNCELVERILWDHFALGLAKVKKDDSV